MSRLSRHACICICRLLHGLVHWSTGRVVTHRSVDHVPVPDEESRRSGGLTPPQPDIETSSPMTWWLLQWVSASGVHNRAEPAEHDSQSSTGPACPLETPNTNTPPFGNMEHGTRENGQTGTMARIGSRPFRGEALRIGKTSNIRTNKVCFYVRYHAWSVLSICFSPLVCLCSSMDGCHETPASRLLPASPNNAVPQSVIHLVKCTQRYLSFIHPFFPLTPIHSSTRRYAQVEY